MKKTTVFIILACVLWLLVLLQCFSKQKIKVQLRAPSTGQTTDTQDDAEPQEKTLAPKSQQPPLPPNFENLPPRLKEILLKRRDRLAP